MVDSNDDFDDEFVNSKLLSDLDFKFPVKSPVVLALVEGGGDFDEPDFVELEFEDNFELFVAEFVFSALEFSDFEEEEFSLVTLEDVVLVFADP